MNEYYLRRKILESAAECASSGLVVHVHFTQSEIGELYVALTVQ